ncbi:caspase domain-containing protein [Rhodocollybia butyracea]|uniref:Caspase domain-containing protein n=1 Tax=Rhodocollybia butyracea TaxID=206335 RepID=A0A9P5PVW8_9AGAR|nr:caspase domain-containing protein [Rhodocollybia butyracea]
MLRSASRGFGGEEDDCRTTPTSVTPDELWKARYPTDTLDVDHDELLKEVQQRYSAGELVEPTLHELGDLNGKKQELISLLRKTHGSENIDVSAEKDLSNSLKKPNGRFHAVIVGINKYDDPRTTSLKGCVNDALLFRDYLLQDLSVPAGQITTLLSPTGDEHLPFPQDIPVPCNAPTRENILDALYDLYDSPNIKPDDSIIIFYAGHGQSYRAPDAVDQSPPRSNASVEALCPADRNTLKSCSDGTEDIIVDISDREINVILGEIAKKICGNITLILDCCYARSGIRGLGDKELFPFRYCPPILSAVSLMFKAADASGRLPSDRPRTADPNFRANMNSHVLIASAKDYEEALEYKDRKTGVSQGYFTSRFISALRSSTSTTTYRDVVESPELVMPFQTAIVAGRKTARLWFA